MGFKDRFTGIQWTLQHDKAPHIYFIEITFV